MEEEQETRESKLNKISKEARERKFDFRVKKIYDLDSIKQLKLYLDCYNFLYLVNNNLNEIYVDTCEEIKEVLNKNNDLFLKAFKLYLSYEKSPGFSLAIKQKKIDNLIIEEKINISELINYTFPIGRMIQEYDPDENVGIPKII